MSLLVVLVCLAAGAAARGRVAPAALTAWVLNVALPAVVVAQMHDVKRVPLVGISAMWLVFGATALLWGVVGRALAWDRATIACLVLCTGLSNTSFVGFPLLEALLGPEALPHAVPIDQLGSFLLVTAAGPIVVALGRPGTHVSPRAILLSLLRFPATWALVAVAIVPHWPASVLEGAERIGDTLTPIALFVTGLHLRPPRLSNIPLLTTGLVWKLACAPVVVWAWVRAWSLDGLPAEVAVLEGAMAPMITGALLAEAAGLRPELAAGFLSVGIPVSLLTVWAWWHLL